MTVLSTGAAPFVLQSQIHLQQTDIIIAIRTRLRAAALRITKFESRARAREMVPWSKRWAHSFKFHVILPTVPTHTNRYFFFERKSMSNEQDHIQTLENRTRRTEQAVMPARGAESNAQSRSRSAIRACERAKTASIRKTSSIHMPALASPTRPTHPTVP